MSRRIEIELTSARPDGTWTWRAAGAKEPKGVVDASVLHAGACVGDVVRAEADFDVDGITVLSVLPPKGARKEPERIVVLGSGKEFEPVLTTLAPKGPGDRRPRRDDGERRPRRDDGRPGGDRGPRGPRPEGAGGERPNRGPRPDRPERPARPPRAPLPTKPKPRRLKPGRVHVAAVIDELPMEHRPIAERLLQGGMQAVRQALEEQNTALAAEGKPTIKPGPLLDLAGDLQGRLRTAEWRDRAEAALAGAEEIDLRDLRSVVAAS
ncbi:MAG: hypothetical protein AB7V43_15750, partial [Acidimicrobiia bacterium]